ncbi:Glycosyltransferase, GT2 family [Friedmanniella luteola]|uniref:Glycosyltransferase, GT2 family n=1 Tax=Friedmanniella luteola TaxID=546871 RepID=A0A1H1YE98_9ACTN|nr:glycosyltransferase family 2 protein [Friedmanniella luteola]SDT19685.1 Glycosyltransferase, GT2 family [Friedmanniella luteola]
MTSVTAAVVVCAYTLERWDDITEALASAARQDRAPDELWLVVDHNDELFERAGRELVAVHPELKVLPNLRTRGLSGARNTALEHVTTDIVVFLDDDAAAATTDWLGRLLEPYRDERVIAVGGSAVPRWPEGQGRPRTLPVGRGTARGELDWVVGCTYRGQPETQQGVRNLMGCNMSFRREVFTAAGGFGEHLGRVGKTPLGCEETELCIRAQRTRSGSSIIFQPTAEVRHHVSLDRLTWRYLLRRCYAEGLSKAAVSRMVGQDQALSTERRYASRVLPAAVLREVASAVSPGPGHRGPHLHGAAAVVLGLAATTIGYVRGRASSLDAAAAPVPVLRLHDRAPTEPA